MCIAIIKPQNIDLISEDILKICFENNPDGAGFAINRNNRIYIYKGFFTFAGFQKAMNLIKPLKEEAMLIHFRVATHGKVNMENCHPFPITDKFNKMILPYSVTEDDVLIHNGKLNINITNYIYSDSMHFSRALNSFNRVDNKKYIDFLIRDTPKNKRGNRVGILTQTGNVESYGKGWIDVKGVLYSNDSYKVNGFYQAKKRQRALTRKIRNQNIVNNRTNNYPNQNYFGANTYSYKGIGFENNVNTF